MSVNPILTVGPALSPYFTCQECVFGFTTATLLANQYAYTTITSFNLLPSGSQGWFTCTGTVFTCVQPGIYHFSPYMIWQGLTVTTSYRGYVALYCNRVGASGGTTIEEAQQIADPTTGGNVIYQKPHWIMRVGAGDTLQFYYENDTSQSSIAIATQNMYVHLLSAI